LVLNRIFFGYLKNEKLKGENLNIFKILSPKAKTA